MHRKSLRAELFPVKMKGEVASRFVGVVDFFFFFQAEDGIRDLTVTGVQTCALPICSLLGVESRIAPPFHSGDCDRGGRCAHPRCDRSRNRDRAETPSRMKKGFTPRSFGPARAVELTPKGCRGCLRLSPDDDDFGSPHAV